MKIYNQTMEVMELLNKEGVCLFKIGNFYHTYESDAYILSYLFNYKVNMIKKDCGFPIQVLNKVISNKNSMWTE